jgi:predicted unusual protein kinase regulating ubiquinone biosynthesis (AarF/ABC1/UbiB family)
MAEKVRTGRFERALALARVGARTGLSLATSVGNDAAARGAFKVLGELRGIATKVGQTLSYVDGVIPEKHRATYEATLRQLQRAVPQSSPSEVRALLEKELGASLGELFTEWSEIPVASGSIGQVHRARLSDGRYCAVKVQHPGVETAIESDLSNVSALLPIIGWVLPPGLDPKELLEEVATRFREELDYQREARQTEVFRQFWAADTTVVVPAVIHTHSSRRVLTTEWLSGETLEAVGIEDEVARRRYAEGLWKFVFRSLLVGGAFNADPHPGNYFFQPDGKIAFLDFGCVQLMPDHARQAALSAHRGAAAGDLGGFREGMTELLQLRAGSYRDATLEYVELCFQPIFQSPFRITRTWAGDLTKLAQELKSVMLERGANLTLPPPHLAMMNRLQFGFYSVLARLDVEVDYRAIEARVLSEAAEVDSGEIRRLLV